MIVFVASPLMSLICFGRPGQSQHASWANAGRSVGGHGLIALWTRFHMAFKILELDRTGLIFWCLDVAIGPLRPYINENSKMVTRVFGILARFPRNHRFFDTIDAGRWRVHATGYPCLPQKLSRRRRITPQSQQTATRLLHRRRCPKRLCVGSPPESASETYHANDARPL